MPFATLFKTSSQTTPGKRFHHTSYTIGWVATLSCEVEAARLMLDEEHEVQSFPRDPNSYILGRAGSHNVAIVFPIKGRNGMESAATITAHMVRSFPNIRLCVLVGIGGGAPQAPDASNPWNDIRLGDVVVSCTDDNRGGVVQYNKRSSPVYRSPGFVVPYIRTLRAEHASGRGGMQKYINNVKMLSARNRKLAPYCFPGRTHDTLFKSGVPHAGGKDCRSCNYQAVEARLPREQLTVHYGVIGSANVVMKSAQERDRIRAANNILCFDMEASGLIQNVPCLVIRGISDYSDGHKNDGWQPYASVTAAAYAKDFLRVLPKLQ